MTMLAELNQTVVQCTRCPRLVRWRETSAQNPPRRYLGEKYWAKPVAGFGDPAARLLIVGLAPAAHGGHRTGRTVTGDGSGGFLMSAVHRVGFPNAPTSRSWDDGLRLDVPYILAAVRCAPPDTKPLPDEIVR